jgi:hypothetical protein
MAQVAPRQLVNARVGEGALTHEFSAFYIPDSPAQFEFNSSDVNSINTNNTSRNDQCHKQPKPFEQ